MNRAPRPSVGLDALADDPAKAAQLTPEERCALVLRAAAALAALGAPLPSGSATLAAAPLDDSRALPVPEVARRLGLTPAYVYELVRRGELPAIRVGKYVRVPENGLRAWQEARQRAGVDGPGYTVYPRRRDGRRAPTSPQAARADAGRARRARGRDPRHDRPAGARRGPHPGTDRPADPPAGADGAEGDP